MSLNIPATNPRAALDAAIPCSSHSVTLCGGTSEHGR